MENGLVKLIKELGFPVAVSLMLLMALMGWLPSPLIRGVEEQTALLRYHAMKDMSQDVLLWQICRNTAKNAGADPNSCVKPWESVK